MFMVDIPFLLYMKADAGVMVYTICTKCEDSFEKNAEIERRNEKVIHTQKSGKMEKNELYTKLYTLSTEKTEKKEVYIVK